MQRKQNNKSRAGMKKQMVGVAMTKNFCGGVGASLGNQ